MKRATRSAPRDSRDWEKPRLGKTRASRKRASRRGGGKNRSATQRAECAARKPGTRVTRRSRRTCCAMRVGRSASASSVASSSEVSDAALHRNAWTARPGMWRAPRPERRALAGARARVAAARKFGRSMRDVTCMSNGDRRNRAEGRLRRAWGCGGRTRATRVSLRFLRKFDTWKTLKSLGHWCQGKSVPTDQFSGRGRACRSRRASPALACARRCNACWCGPRRRPRACGSSRPSGTAGDGGEMTANRVDSP